MKNLIILLVLLSFVLVPFNTNAGNIDYSKTEIKLSGKNYTLEKVKDLLYKNITNKVNLKQTESLKIDSYNSFIKTLDKIIIQAKKSSKTQNIHLGYMLEDLKQSLNLDLEKITNKTSQIEEKKEVLENTNIEEIKTKYQNSVGNIYLSNKFRILDEYYIPEENYIVVPGLNEAIENIRTKDITNDSLVSKVINTIVNFRSDGYTLKIDIGNNLNDLIKINKSYFGNPTFGFDYINPLLKDINVDKNKLKSLRAFVSDEGKSKLISVQFFGQKFNTNVSGYKLDYGDYSNIDILESYDNGKTLLYGKSGVIYNDGVKFDENFKIITNMDGDLKDGDLSETNKAIYNKYYKIAENLYNKSNGTIKYDINLSDLINNSENKLIGGVDNEIIKNQRIKTSENGKSKLTKIKINFQGDGMGVEVVEYYENGQYFGFGYPSIGMGYSVAKATMRDFKEKGLKASITQINGVSQGKNFIY